MTGYYDRDGKPITPAAWADLFDDWPYKQIASTKINGATVSTVWLGLNHQWSSEGPPLIFETMIFGGHLDGAQWRYTTEQQARVGHAAAAAIASKAPAFLEDLARFYGWDVDTTRDWLHQHLSDTEAEPIALYGVSVPKPRFWRLRRLFRIPLRLPEEIQ